MDKKILLAVGLAVLLTLFVTGQGVSIQVAAPEPDGAPVEVTPPAETETPIGDVTDWLFKVLGAVPNLISVAALGGLSSGAVDLLKMTGLFTRYDGISGRVTAVVNLGVYLAITFANLFGYGPQTRDLIEQFGPALPGIVTVLGMLGASKVMHKLLKMFDPKAFSLSAQRPGIAG